MGQFHGQPQFDNLCARDEERLAEAFELCGRKRMAVKEAADGKVEILKSCRTHFAKWLRSLRLVRIYCKQIECIPKKITLAERRVADLFRFCRLLIR